MADVIAVELRRQYAIGVLPAASAGERGWHDVKVKVADLRDAKGKAVKLHARTRKGFYAPAAGTR